MYLIKSIKFLLENAGPVIRYRLRNEILNNLSQNEEEELLEQIYQTPHFKLLQSYIKPNGYIGSGMHSWSNWRGVKLHETPLQDEETAARLLSYYAIPKTHPIIVNFISAMRDEEILHKEFSYIPPEITRFEHRFKGLNNGNCLMSLIYTMQAMLGYGDDFDDLKEFQQVCLEGFRHILKISSLNEITKIDTNTKRAYNYPYIEVDDYFPNAYTLTMLAYTKSWRTNENIKMLADSFNHINKIMKPDNTMHVRINGKFYGPCFAFIRPLRAYRSDIIDSILYRRPLTEIAMLGVGEKVDILRESIESLKLELIKDGILRMNFSLPQNRYYSPKKIEYPTAYVDIQLEPNHKTNISLQCDLTFWATQLLHLSN